MNDWRKALALGICWTLGALQEVRPVRTITVYDGWTVQDDCRSASARVRAAASIPSGWRPRRASFRTCSPTMQKAAAKMGAIFAGFSAPPPAVAQGPESLSGCDWLQNGYKSAVFWAVLTKH